MFYREPQIVRAERTAKIERRKRITDVVYIYGIFNIASHELLYVGKTAWIADRLRQHQQYLFKDIKDLISLEILEVAKSAQNSESEIFWINYAKFLGCNLRNKQYNRAEAGKGVHLNNAKAIAKVLHVQVEALIAAKQEAAIIGVDLAKPGSDRTVKQIVRLHKPNCSCTLCKG